MGVLHSDLRTDNCLAAVLGPRNWADMWAQALRFEAPPPGRRQSVARAAEPLQWAASPAGTLSSRTGPVSVAEALAPQ